MNKKIHLEPVDPENWRIGFQLNDDQKHYVANPSVILARAGAYRNYEQNLNGRNWGVL